MAAVLMQVRAATEDDVAHLARLRAAWREQPLTSEFVETFGDWFAREYPSRWWWIATADQDPVGMVNVKLVDRMPSPDRPPSRWGYLANLYVDADRRGSGVGSALVAAAVERARAEGLVRLVLYPSELAVPLYGRHGFRPAHDLLVRPLDHG